VKEKWIEIRKDIEQKLKDLRDGPFTVFYEDQLLIAFYADQLKIVNSRLEELEKK